MRAVIAAIFALMLASPAFSKVAIIVDRSRGAFSQTDIYIAPLFQGTADVGRAYVTGLLDRINPGSYDIFGIDAVKTEWARTGLINGTQYTGVIWAGYISTTTGLNPHTTCYPCSLTVVAAAPTVPQLFVEAGVAETQFSTSTSCSTGYAGDSVDPGAQGPHHGSGEWVMPGTSYRWRTGWLTGARTTTIPAGTVRPIIKMNEARYVGSASPLDRDSLLSDADVGAAYGQSYTYLSQVLMRYMDHVAGAKPIIFARWGSTSPTMMGGTNSPQDDHSNGTPLAIWAAMALMDSVTNHALFGTNPRPVRIGIQISGLAARGASTGILPHDTTNVFASLDSINALNVPVAFGVNLDSAQTYLRDVRRAANIRLARFAPENRSGTVTGTPTGSASWTLPRDLWGAQRSRSFIGPVNTTAADTSVKALAVSSFWHIDSIFGSGRRSTIGMAPSHDWSPSGMTGQSADNRDSLIIAALAGGFSGLSMNIETDTLTTSVGLPQGQGIDRGFYFLAYPGTLKSGATNDVYHVGGGDPTNEALYVQDYITRVLRGAVMGFWKAPQVNPRSQYDDLALLDRLTEQEVSAKAAINRPCSVARISMCELGSGSSQTEPARPGFYAIKYLKNYCDAVNRLAGRALFSIVPVDGLTSADLAR